MSRTQKDVVSYFPHDSGASNGDTLAVLQSRFGNDGYAFWFKLLEKLASTEGHCIDCSNPIKWQLLLAKTGVNEITGVDIMNLLVEMQAIDKELWQSKLIWCQKLVDNISDVYKNRRREIPLKPITTIVNDITTDDKALTTDDIPQSKVNKSKVNKSKVDKIILPEWIDTQTWDDFLDMRKKKHTNPTQKAQRLIIKELEKLQLAGNDPNDVLNQSIMRNYTGVFPVKGERDAAHRGDTQKAPTDPRYRGRPPESYAEERDEIERIRREAQNS